MYLEKVLQPPIPGVGEDLDIVLSLGNLGIETYNIHEFRSEREFKFILLNKSNLDGSISTTETNIDITSGDGISFSVGDVIYIDKEQMLINVINVDTLTVEREYNNSLLQNHDDLSDIYIDLELPKLMELDASLKIKFVLEISSKDFLPFFIYIDTDEQGKTTHIVRVAGAPSQALELKSSMMQFVNGNIINLDDNGSTILTVETTSHDVVIPIVNIGEETLQIEEVSFINKSFEEFEFLSVDLSSSGVDIPPDETRNITLTFDFSNSYTGLVASGLLPDLSEIISYKNGFDLSSIGYIKFSTNSKKSYFFEANGEEITVNEGTTIAKISGNMFLPSSIEIIKNDENLTDPISFNYLIEETNRRTEQLIISNAGQLDFTILDIESNYLVSTNDALTFLYNNQPVSNLVIPANSTIYVDIHMDTIKMLDYTPGTTEDDNGVIIRRNETFYKTITITTDGSPTNVDSNDKFYILTPFSVFYNRLADNYPYSFILSERPNVMSRKDGEGNFITNSTYEFPYGYEISPLEPSTTHTVELRIRNLNSAATKTFKIEIVDNNKNWDQRPFLVVSGIEKQQISGGEKFITLPPNSTTGSVEVGGEGITVSGVYAHVKTNHVMTENNLGEIEERFDLLKEGENIVIKITQVSLIDGQYVADVDGNNVEKSIVQYIVGTWRAFEFHYYSQSLVKHPLKEELLHGGEIKYFSRTHIKTNPDLLDIGGMAQLLMKNYYSRSYLKVYKNIIFPYGLFLPPIAVKYSSILEFLNNKMEDSLYLPIPTPGWRRKYYYSKNHVINSSIIISLLHQGEVIPVQEVKHYYSKQKTDITQSILELVTDIFDPEVQEVRHYYSIGKNFIEKEQLETEFIKKIYYSKNKVLPGIIKEIGALEVHLLENLYLPNTLTTTEYVNYFSKATAVNKGDTNVALETEIPEIRHFFSKFITEAIYFDTKPNKYQIILEYQSFEEKHFYSKLTFTHTHIPVTYEPILYDIGVIQSS